MSQSPTCPGCGLNGGNGVLADSTTCHSSRYCWELYQELILYTLSLGDNDFIHQHVIDAYTAQHSSPELKGIQISFALIGIYLYLEQHYSGRAVQHAHRQLAEKRKKWPILIHSQPVTEITVQSILLQINKDAFTTSVHDWSETVWQAWEADRSTIIELYNTSIRGNYPLKP